MALSAACRNAIRTEYCNGAFVRALARRHGVHESSIREMARKQNWTRDPQAAARVRQANLPNGLDGIVARYFPRRQMSQRPAAAFTPNPTYEAVPEAVGKAIEDAIAEIAQFKAEGMAKAEAGIAQFEANAKADIQRAVDDARKEIGEVVLQARTDAIARANRDALGRAEKLGLIWDALTDRLGDILQRPESEAQRARQAEALKILLPGRRDRLSACIGLAGTLMMQIQNAKRKALGLDRPPPPPPEPKPARPDEAPTVIPDPEKIFAFYQNLTVEELRTVWQAGRILEGKHRPPPCPMPPDDPGETANAAPNGQGAGTNAPAASARTTGSALE